MEVGQSGQIDDILAVDPREHPLVWPCSVKQKKTKKGLRMD